MYGFSHFYRKRDPASKRGYQQVSFKGGRGTTEGIDVIWIVFLSPPHSPSISLIVYLDDHPTWSAFPQARHHNARNSMPQYRELVRHLLAMFFISFESMDAKERRNPSLGSTVELGFLGSVLHVELPVDTDSQQLAETSKFDERFNPKLHVSIPGSRVYLILYN